MRFSRSFSSHGVITRQISVFFLCFCALLYLSALRPGLSSFSQDEYKIEFKSARSLNNEGEERFSDPGRREEAKRLLDSISLAADYITNHLNDDGKFVYQVRLDGGEVEEDYNLLRHAGTLYSLGLVHELLPSRVPAGKVRRAADWLLDQQAPLDHATPHVAPLWSTPPESHVICAKLGGAGLGLAALITAARFDPAVVTTRQLEKLAAFVHFMMGPDGQFSFKYVKDAGVTSFQSLYYPGEACLGLVMLFSHTGDRKWFDLALKAMLHLAESRESTPPGDVLPDHWALISSREILKHKDLLTTTEIGKLQRHSVKIMTKFELEYNTYVETGVSGAFDSKGSSAPSCTRLEGLTAMMHSLPHELCPASTPALVRSAVNFTLAMQEPETSRFSGGFRRCQSSAGSCQDIRIDYVQHCVSCLVRYYQYLTRGAMDL